jgi:hypothetical protein
MLLLGVKTVFCKRVLGLMTSVDAFARPFYVCVLRLIIPHYFWFKKGWLLSRSTTLAHMVSFIVILFAQRLSRLFLTMTLLGRPLGAYPCV